ncbi:MAG TPA: ABC transporter substrate-binding protein [Jiangellaceae bacterium]
MRAAGRLVALAVVPIVVLTTSCGLVKSALGEDDAGPQVATVAVLVPGGAAGGGVSTGVIDAVELAIAETTSDVPGWSVEVSPVEEGTEPAEMTTVVEDMVEDDVVAVIGGLSTDAIRTAQPVLDQASILFVSPADVAPEHTRGADPATPLRPYPTYYRTSVGGETALAALARYAVDGLGAATIAVIDAGDAAGSGEFVTAARRAGAQVPVTGHAGESGEKIADVLATAATAEVDAVFVAGGPNRAAMVAEEIAEGGLEATLLLAPELSGPPFVEAAGASAEGAASVVPPTLTSTLDAAPEALTAKLTAAGSAAPGRFGAAAYDAATAVGTVLAQCLPPAGSPSGARKGCEREMPQISFAGVTGDVGFDDFGERLGGTPEVITVHDGAWTELNDVE